MKTKWKRPTFTKEKYLNLAKQLGGAGYKAIVMAIQVSARGFIESSVKDPQGKLPIFGNKYLMLLAD